MRKQRNRPTKSSLTESAAILYNYFYPSNEMSASVDDDRAFDGDQYAGKTLGIGESRKSWNRLIERIKAASNDLRS